MSAENPSISWLGSAGHRSWLMTQADSLFRFYERASIDPRGGFYELTTNGRPSLETTRHLVWTARLVYCFSLADMLGRPGASVIVRHGLESLERQFKDKEYGGHFWITDATGPVDTSKQAYGIAHVILAGAAATRAGYDDGRLLLAKGLAELDAHFWREDDGLVVEEFQRDWVGPSRYRGANSNMHLVEALLNATAATGELSHSLRALKIADGIIRVRTQANEWRIAEHYTDDWLIDRAYNSHDPDNIFRPFGSIIGHWFEWSRLLLQAGALIGDDASWTSVAAENLFRMAVEEGWDNVHGGLIYTVDFEGRPLNRDRYWWPIAEGICAAAYLAEATNDRQYERWYRTFWDFAATHLIDHARGGWQHVLDPQNDPKFSPYAGKVDIFHALHACLLPLLPKDQIPITALAAGAIDIPGCARTAPLQTQWQR